MSRLLFPMVFLVAMASLADGPAIAPKFLWSPQDADALERAIPDSGVTVSAAGDGFSGEIAPGPASWPGITL